MKNNRIRLVFQDVKIEYTDEYQTLIHMLFYNKEFKKWVVLDSVFDDDVEVNILSCYIAKCINNWGGYKFYTSENTRFYDCECCGSYSVTTTTISSISPLLSPHKIKVIEDDHNGSRGFSDEDIIDDWNKMGYELDIIRC